MKINLKPPFIKGRGIKIISFLVLVFLGFSPFFEGKIGKVEADLIGPILNSTALKESELVVFQGNILASFSNPNNPPPKIIQKIEVVVTGYSSTPWETDGNPYLTAAGTKVREGIAANNFLPFGTKIRIPELFGDKVFVIEDRMSWKKGNYHIDIWFPSYLEALNFGAKRTYIEVLEK